MDATTPTWARPRLIDNPEYRDRCIALAREAESGRSAKAIAAGLGISPATAYRYINNGKMFLLGSRVNAAG